MQQKKREAERMPGKPGYRKMALNSAETKEGTEDEVQKYELAGRSPFSLKTAIPTLPKQLAAT